MTDNDTRIKLFENELMLISDPEISRLVMNILCKVPDYFFRIPASSSGKYHPEFAKGDGGLVRHTKAAVRIADMLSPLHMFELSEHERDIAIAALILHDSYKAGRDDTSYDAKKRYMTDKNHAQTAAEEIRSYADNDPDNNAGEISDAVLTHMGQWNEAAGEPKTKLQKFVHLCDYLASRKNIEILL